MGAQHPSQHPGRHACARFDEALENVRPALRRGQGRSVRDGAFTVALESPMLEIYASRSGIRNETYFDLACACRIRYGLAMRSDLPGEDESPRRVPDLDTSPIATEAMRTTLITETAGAWLDADPVEHGARPGVFPRPPGLERAREELERLRDRQADAGADLNGRNLLLSHRSPPG
jgi:hypothetical protein